MKLPGLENAKTAEALGSENAILKQKLADLQRELVDVNREKTLFGDRLRAAETAMTDAGVPVPVHETGPDTVVASPSATATGSSSLAPLAPLGSGGGASVRAGGLAPVGGGGGGNAAVCAKCGGGVSDGAVSSAAAGVEAGSGGGAAEVAELQGKLKAAEAELHAKQAETAALQEQMEMRINQTPQFKSLNQVGCSFCMHATPATHEGKLAHTTSCTPLIAFTAIVASSYPTANSQYVSKVRTEAIFCLLFPLPLSLSPNPREHPETSAEVSIARCHAVE